MAAGGIGGLLLLVLALTLGINPGDILNQGTGVVEEEGAPRSAAENELADFVSVVLADTEETWHGLFRQMGRAYREPKLVLFSGAVESACGFAGAAVGPFYCPPDESIYIDLEFYQDLKERYGAPGDFAQAYVVAHEVGHHVQNLLGISDQVQSAQQRAHSQEQANAYSVRLELQADCLAGVYGHFNKQTLDPGDVEEGLRAAAAIGDDMIQQQSQGYTAPESWTHGSAEMRVKWLRQGLQVGDPSGCDTFKGN
jgi:predicted metalloprotease